MSRRALSSAPVRSHSDDQSGQGLVELALVAPILILLLMAIFQFAFVFQTQMGLANAVREAARRASSTADPTADWVRVQLCGSNPARCDDGLLAANVQGFSETRLVGSAPNDVDICFSTYAVNSVTNYRITIGVTYLNPVFFPLLAYATDWIDGTGDGNWELSESAEMRLDYDLATPPGSC